MATNLPQWVGSKGLEQHPSSGKVVQDAVKTSVTRIYEGPYLVCLGAQPTIGQTFADLPGTVVVVGSECAPAPAGTDGAKARLTITLETAYATTFETEWVEVDRPLILNSRYWDGSTPDTTPAGLMPLTLTDKSMIEKWEAEENPVLKFHFIYKVVHDTLNTGAGLMAPISSTAPGYTAGDGTQFTSGTIVAGNAYDLFLLTAQAQDYAAKRLKGEEAYRIYGPVIRQTSESLDPPDNDPAGLLENPPPDSNPPNGYTWQRTAKRITRTGPYGKYRTQFEWQGADRIDVDLYGQSSDGTAPNPST